uniref:Signal transducer and activator of transcription n=1 Tax=Globodera rostochiensis TaxID=31243 RepID=A0A914GW51_GLORO
MIGRLRKLGIIGRWQLAMRKLLLFRQRLPPFGLWPRLLRAAAVSTPLVGDDYSSPIIPGAFIRRPLWQQQLSGRVPIELGCCCSKQVISLAAISFSSPTVAAGDNPARERRKEKEKKEILVYRQSQYRSGSPISIRQMQQLNPVGGCASVPTPAAFCSGASPSSSVPPSANSTEQQRTVLMTLTKDCQTLWEQNKDMQGRFVNDLTELQRLQLAISQLEAEQRHDQLKQTRHQMMEMQRRASQLYEQLTDRRANLVQRLNDGVQLIVLMQSQLISERLLDWKNCQKLSQIGVVFEQREQILDEIQSEFEVLAENNWTLRACACWQLDLLKRSPRLSDSQSVQSHISNLTYILETLTKLLCMLVTQSFVVAVQPDPVLKTQHKFVAEVRLLIGERLGIKQQLINTNVTVKIIAEEEAKMLSTGQLNEKDIKTVGSISNDFEKLVLDERGHMAAKFNNSKLSRIAHRKPPAKGSLQASQCAQTATDQKYALLFHITPFQLGNLGKFDVWTLSLPIMDCDAQAVILWQRAFSSVNRTNASDDVSMVAWPDLSRVLRHKFFLFTGANRPLSESDLAYLGDKLGMHSHGDNKPITFQRFAKQNLRDDVNFSFWEWFFLIMQLIKQKLLKFWDEGWLVGFISKQDTSSQMMMCPNLTFLLRFSDTQTGAVSIGFVCEEDGMKVPFHLAPFTIKDLDQLSLASRIRNCPQLQEIRYLHPDIEKEEMLAFFESEEQRLRANETSPTGYIGSEIVMVAKTAGCKLNSALGSDSPSPMSNQWSPGELQQSNSMEISDDIVSMLNQNQLEAANVESLLGFQVGHRMAVDQQQQPMPQLDLSFMDSFSVQPNAVFLMGQQRNE